ncbi:hypothetical protein HYQ46_004185 [Verticillium longisporum]|nr:hypothetical protein HYQ46_004185 [Verticillium longisporum]
MIAAFKNNICSPNRNGEGPPEDMSRAAHFSSYIFLLLSIFFSASSLLSLSPGTSRFKLCKTLDCLQSTALLK